MRRYAELTSALLCIGATGVVSSGAAATAHVLDASTRTAALCTRLSTEIHSLLQRITAHLYAPQEQKRTSAYLINNYDLVYSIYMVGGRGLF